MARVKLLEAQVNPPHQLIFLQTIPWFCQNKNEANDAGCNIDFDTRRNVTPKLSEANVKYVFAGHSNAIGKDNSLEIIQTNSLAKTDDNEAPGFRLVKVEPMGVLHKYFPADNSPSDLANLEL